MAVVESPPINIPFIDQNGNVSERWNLWFESVDRKLAEGGGTGGEFLGDVNTGFTISTDANIYINGLLLEQPTNENQIAVSSGSTISWISTEDLAATPTGVIRPMIDENIPEGWIILDDGTIGNAASGASNRANADTEDLYTQIWNSISDTYAPVSGGRGASASADFAAGKPIQLATIAGRGLKLMGTLGVTQGAETFTMTENMVPEHHHTYVGKKLDGSGDIVTSLVYAPPTTATVPPFNTRFNTQYPDNDAVTDDLKTFNRVGEGSPQPILQSTVYFKFMIKL